METPQFIERDDPEEIFGVLSDDTRVAILRKLWETDRKSMTFSQLREAVGMDDSGQFNYHLDKLVGRFVEKTGEGYSLTQAGDRINGAIAAGSYTVEATLDPITLDGACPSCGGERTLYYEDERVRVECESCSVTAAFGVPPSVFADCRRERIPAVAGQYLWTTFQQIQSGFCSACDGHVSPHVGAATAVFDERPGGEEEELIVEYGDLPVIAYECQRCGDRSFGGLSLAFLSHPAVASLFYDHGITVRGSQIWEFAGFRPEDEQISQHDPFRASVTYTVETASVTLVVDDALSVLEVNERTHTS